MRAPTWRCVLLAGVLLHGIAFGQHADPAREEVPLPAQNGWQASLVLDAGQGVWTVRALQLEPEYGQPEIVALDDLGQCTILRGYSGKWFPLQTVRDGRWLAPVAHADVDPDLDGKELYASGQSGRIYQIWPRPRGGFDTRVVAEWPGDEVHTLVAGELDAARAGEELFAFTLHGDLWRVDPRRGQEPTRMATGLGRVRDAVVLPAAAETSPWIACVSRARTVALLRVTGGQLERRIVLEEDMGFGRICARQGSERTVLYVTRDDGLVLRLEEQPEGTWKREAVYAGPQGPRGIVAGRFDADPDCECLAVFGYSKRVQLLRRRPGEPWQVETIFEDVDAGHWLEACELDGRNKTQEILCSGYSGRVCLLYRPAGYGWAGVATDPDGSEATLRDEAPKSAVRVGVRARLRELSMISPLSYRGGFHTKTLVYETLVQRGEDGRLVPGLAESWRIEDEGRTLRLALRPHAKWHDGKPVHAKDVAVHFRRWLQLPEHAWLRACMQIRDVEAPAAHELVLRLREPAAVLPELTAVNPCAIRGPGALDREGAFVHPVGSGPWRVIGVQDQHYVYQRVADGMRIDLVPYSRQEANIVLEALRHGEIDVFVAGWDDPAPLGIPRAIAADDALELGTAPGTSVQYVSFALHGGPTQQRAVREAVRAAIDRGAMIETLEDGLADPCYAWAAPAVSVWPQANAPARDAPARVPAALEGTPLRILCGTGMNRARQIAELLATQLRAAGFAPEVAALEGSAYRKALQREEWDLRIERTWGMPYDPYLSLVSRFLPPTEETSAAAIRYFGVPKELEELVTEVLHTPDEAGRLRLYARIQAIMDREALLVPLYAPRRYAIWRRGWTGIGLPLDPYRIDLSELRRAK